MSKKPSTLIMPTIVATSAVCAMVAATAPPAAEARLLPGVRGAALAQFSPPATRVPGPDEPESFDATLPNGRRVTPAGVSAQVGQNPLNSVLTEDGRFLLTSNNMERNGPPRTGAAIDPLDTKNGATEALSQYTVAVTDTATMKVATAFTVPTNATPHPGSTANGATDRDNVAGLFLGLASMRTSTGYRVYASGGVANVVYQFELDADGKAVGAPTQISIPVPQDKTRATYGMAMPGWLTLSPDKKTLYVVNNNGNSVVAVDVATAKPGEPVPVGYFPYAAQLYKDKLFVSNWGLTERVFADGAGTTNPTTGVVSHTGTPFIGGGTANLFANPSTDPQRSSSLTVLTLGGAGTSSSISLARPIDGVNVVGGTHPSALALAVNDKGSALYVAAANEDRIAVVDPDRERLVASVELPAPGDAVFGLGRSGPPDASETFGLSPDALAVSPDQRTLYVAEAGLNSVAVYDVTHPHAPKFRGRIPTGWYPTAVTVSPDGNELYVTNAKGAGSPYRYQGIFVPNQTPPKFTNPDVNWQFGSVQKIDLGTLQLRSATQQVEANTVVHQPLPPGERHKLAVLSRKIKHVIFVLRENKTYDTYFGDDQVLNSRGANGDPAYAQYGAYVPAIKALAEQFAVGDNNYADAEESNAGHSFALAGQSSDFQQKTLSVRTTRPLVNIKNQDPEDYPLQGYIFNAMARAGKTYRDYGDAVRITGFNDAASTDYCANDPKPGCTNATYNSILDTTSPTVGLGGLYSETLPALKVLAGHLDEHYPGWNVRISDQRRVKEFIGDFDPLVKAGSAPTFTHIWLPVDHTGACTTPAVATCSPTQQVRDSDEALGQLMNYLSHSAIWPSTAVFIAADDAQSSPDHVYAHRTYTVVASPWVQRGQVVHTLGSTVSIPKTIEEILNLPPMSYSDLMAGDLLDYFTTTPDFTPFAWPPTGDSGSAVASAAARQRAETQAAAQVPAETARIWQLAGRLDSSTYDTSTEAIGTLTTLFFDSLKLSQERGSLSAGAYQSRQDALYAQARAAVDED
jgi:DNA-binding beta-propeller fold protein YncE